jgi:ribosomal protein S27AE
LKITIDTGLPDNSTIHHLAYSKFILICPRCGELNVPTEVATGTTSFGAEMLICKKCNYTEVLGG